MRLFRILFWFAVVVVATFLSTLGFLFTMSMPAHASAWSAQTCNLVARDVGIFHDMKTEGVTWEQVEPKIMESLDLALHSKDSYIKDMEDVKRGYAIAKFVWDHELSRDDAQQIVGAVCMKHWKGVEI